MTRPYLILVNGIKWDEKLTEAGAMKVALFLRQSGRTNVSIARKISNEYEPLPSSSIFAFLNQASVR